MVLPMPGPFWLDERLVEIGVNQCCFGPPILLRFFIIVPLVKMQFQRELSDRVDVGRQPADEESQRPWVGVRHADAVSALCSFGQ